ncbi:MAG TPA: TolC family protein [Polyangiaceae bacterium]|nr:TolC family protein [Polyangiaceae bacterium]
MFDYRWSSAVALVAALAAASSARAETPEVKSARLGAVAAAEEAEAEAELPPPELTLDVWRVPVTRPYDVPAADMIRLGIEQELSSPGERRAAREAAQLRGRALLAEAQGRSRALSLRVLHARAELAQVESSHRVHEQHLALAERTLALANARHAAGGSLADATIAEIEVSRARAEVAGDAARSESAAEVMALLQHSGADASAAPKGERPELLALRLSREAELVNARAARSRSSWPDFRVGASYFAPTTGRAEHGFGITLGMKLPWLWGARNGRARAALSRAEALEAEHAAKQRDLATDAAVARGQLQAIESSLRVTREQTLPVIERNHRLAESNYASGAGRLEDTLRAAALLLDTQMEIVRAEAEIAHLKLDVAYLEAGSTPATAASEEATHVH